MQVPAPLRRGSSRRFGGALLVLVLAVAGCASESARRSEPRCVFVDGGAHFGESYTLLQQTRLYAEYEWEIFAIEANPYLIGDLPRAPRLTVIDKAIWTKDGKLTFYLESETSGGNSIFDKFKKKKDAFSIEVDSFDFSLWLRDNFSPDDYVVLSLDIEGAEYDVLDKMIADDTVGLIDRLYVELHWNLLLKEMDQNAAMGRGRKLLRHFERAGVIVGDDSADGIMVRGDWIDLLLQAPKRL